MLLLPTYLTVLNEGWGCAKVRFFGIKSVSTTNYVLLPVRRNYIDKIGVRGIPVADSAKMLQRFNNGVKNG